MKPDASGSRVPLKDTDHRIGVSALMLVRGQDSNLRHGGYESPVLPTELPRHGSFCFRWIYFQSTSCNEILLDLD